MKLDIFGEIVVTLGTAPQGQGHETTASQVVAGHPRRHPDDVHVRAGHDSYWNTHAASRGRTRASSPSPGSARSRARPSELAHEIKRLAAAVLELRRTTSSWPRAARLARRTPRPRCRSWRSGRSSTPTTRSSRRTSARSRSTAATSTCRRQVPGQRAQVRQPDAYVRDADPRRVVEIDQETGDYDIVDYAAVDDCGVRINPQIVEGQVHGALAQGSARPRTRSSPTTRTGTC